MAMSSIACTVDDYRAWFDDRLWFGNDENYYQDEEDRFGELGDRRYEEEDQDRFGELGDRLYRDQDRFVQIQFRGDEDEDEDEDGFGEGWLRGVEYEEIEDQNIYLTNGDNVVVPINRTVAQAESVAFRERNDDVPAIHLPGIDGNTIRIIVAACDRNHRFNQHLQSHRASVRDLVRFLIANNPHNFPQLHRAAVLLNIPNMLMLTSELGRLLMENAEVNAEQIADWYLRLSMERELFFPLEGGEDFLNNQGANVNP